MVDSGKEWRSWLAVRQPGILMEWVQVWLPHSCAWSWDPLGCKIPSPDSNLLLSIEKSWARGRFLSLPYLKHELPLPPMMLTFSQSLAWPEASLCIYMSTSLESKTTTETTVQMSPRFTQVSAGLAHARNTEDSQYLFVGWINEQKPKVVKKDARKHLTN